VLANYNGCLVTDSRQLGPGSRQYTGPQMIHTLNSLSAARPSKLYWYRLSRHVAHSMWKNRC